MPSNGGQGGPEKARRANPATPGTGTEGGYGPVLYTVRSGAGPGATDGPPVPFREGTRARFGRDDEQCLIAAWTQMQDIPSLSRVVGELWCEDGRMWVRNDSWVHDLVVSDRHGARGRLAACADGLQGDAMTIPVPSGRLTVPTAGPWGVDIERVAPLPPARDRPVPPPASEAGPPRQDAAGRQEPPGDRLTVSVGDIPDGLRDVANALCAPMLSGATVPAPYRDIARACGVSKAKARNVVVELCELYLPQVEALHPHTGRDEERRVAAVALLLVGRHKVPAPPDDPAWRQDRRRRAARQAFARRAAP